MWRAEDVPSSSPCTYTTFGTGPARVNNNKKKRGLVHTVYYNITHTHGAHDDDDDDGDKAHPNDIYAANK